MAEEEKDDWLDDLDDDSADGTELDQSDLDALLSGDGEDSSSDSTELDQSDIDSLLSGTDEADSSDDGGGELDQSDIDSLLSGDDDDGAELDQSDIDSLLSDTEEPDSSAYEVDPAQSEIDELFSEVESGDFSDDPFQAEEIDFKDVVGDEDAAFDESAFDADEFGLDDDIPDIPLDDGDETTIFEHDSGREIAEPAQIMDTVSADDIQPAADSSKTSKFSLPPFLKNKKIMAAAASGLVVLIVAGIFLFRGKDDVAQVPPPQPVTPVAPVTAAQAPPEQSAPNNPPLATDSFVQIKQGSTELAISLLAQDTEGDALDYEILSLPEHGRLSGKAPNLIYLPNKNFPGKDTFVFRVNDGKNFSDPGTVSIISPVPVSVPQPVVVQQIAEVPSQPATTPDPTATPKTIKSRKLIIAAQDRSFKISSTENVIIDWEEVWESSNYLPFTPDVKVEIVSDNLHGKLKKINKNIFDYQPDKYFGGQEYISYRFKLAKMKSRVKKLKFNINIGSPPPEINLAKLAENYGPGETVMLDASGSRDENRRELEFSWQQISGVPVQLEKINEEGSQVAFVVPSTFNTVANPGPMLRLTAIDSTGKKDVRDIKIATHSRRQNAVWRGLLSGGIAEDPQCPYGNCPGALLPWPYSE